MKSYIKTSLFDHPLSASTYMVSGTSFNVKSALRTLRSNITIGGSYAPFALTQAMTVICALSPVVTVVRCLHPLSAMTLDLCACNGNPDSSTLKMRLGKLISSFANSVCSSRSK